MNLIRRFFTWFLSLFAAGVMSGLLIKGKFNVVCRNPDGSLAWEAEVPNAWTTVGRNSLLNVYFGAATQITTWYIGLVDNSGFSAFAAADTSASHAGWTESTDYDESVRQTFSPAAASAGSIVNSSPPIITCTTGSTIKGFFLISVATKGGTTGVLACTGALPSNQTLTSGQTLSLQYTIPATAL